MTSTHHHTAAGAPATNDLFSIDTEGLTEVVPTTVVRLHDGDSLDLRISAVSKRVGGDVLRMLAYNGSIPGPTLHVDQHAELTLEVANDADLEATVHWHGLRVENRYDGVAFETQAPIPIGGTYTQKIRFPDGGSLLVPPPHPRGLWAGAGLVWHGHCRAVRPVVLASD